MMTAICIEPITISFYLGKDIIRRGDRRQAEATYSDRSRPDANGGLEHYREPSMYYVYAQCDSGQSGVGFSVDVFNKHFMILEEYRHSRISDVMAKDPKHRQP